jgi:hypothetical protein
MDQPAPTVPSRVLKIAGDSDSFFLKISPTALVSGKKFNIHAFSLISGEGGKIHPWNIRVGHAQVGSLSQRRPRKMCCARIFEKNQPVLKFVLILIRETLDFLWVLAEPANVRRVQRIVLAQ